MDPDCSLNFVRNCHPTASGDDAESDEPAGAMSLSFLGKKASAGPRHRVCCASDRLRCLLFSFVRRASTRRTRKT